jgi:6-pyruvoyl-tetrahydropterin synthase
MYKVGIRSSFRARHFLAGIAGPESSPHEHTYALQWACAVETLDEHGFSVDIALLEELLQQGVEAVRGQLLNDLEFFWERQPSVENMAGFFHGSLLAALAGRGYPVARIVSTELTIWESDSAWASYSAP